MARVVNQAELAEIFDVSPQTINAWQAEGLPVAIKGKRGTQNHYDTAKVINWYVVRQSGKSEETQKDRLARVQADRIEMQMAQERGEFVAADEIGPAWQGVIIDARQQLLTLPARTVPLLAQMGSQQEPMRDLLDQEIESALRKLSGEDDEPGTNEDSASGAGAVGAATEDAAVAVGGRELPTSGGNGHAGQVSFRGNALSP